MGAIRYSQVILFVLKWSRSGKELGEYRDGQRQKIEKISAFIFQALKEKID